MKTKPALVVTTAAARHATLKVARLRRIVEAEDKLAHAAKVRFKGAKKTWKLAHKTAKHSAKKLKQAEKKLARLGQQRKHDTSKEKALPAKRRRPASANRSALASTPAQPSPQD